MDHHDTAPAPEPLVAALAAVEACGRLAVHVAAALERGDVDTAHRLLLPITATSAGAVSALAGQDIRAQVMTAARDQVNPLVGWKIPTPTA